MRGRDSLIKAAGVEFPIRSRAFFHPPLELQVEPCAEQREGGARRVAIAQKRRACGSHERARGSHERARGSHERACGPHERAFACTSARF